MAAFGPRSPASKSSHLPTSSLSPAAQSSPSTMASRPPRSSSLKPNKTTSTRFSTAFVQLPPTTEKTTKVKRRPAPLQLASNSAEWRRSEVSRSPVSTRVMSTSTASIGVVAEARREFVEASFAPQPVLHRVPPAAAPTPSPTAEVVPIARPRKIIIASLNPRDDMAKCREWAAASGMVMSGDGELELGTEGGKDVDMCVSRGTGSVARKKRLGFGALFGRK
ncbi:hypothetical protein NP233_g5809 [Leucocoprinus birnbaumii]|uniref:Uncharacterized protein n=1 Tax=Leucocoprinus birnbaumii TaxID=56174 RepID=A0AAD5VS50_9AGAR|nr:hypothetical protein NP233_g5809 [Leucocoprinus birnbaumii]